MIGKLKKLLPLMYTTEQNSFLDRRDGVSREDELAQPRDVVCECSGGHGRDGVGREVEAVEVGEAAEGVGGDGREAAAGQVQLLQVVQVARREGVVAEPSEVVAGENQHLGGARVAICKGLIIGSEKRF